MTNCPACQTPNPPGTSFCMKCGTQLTASSPATLIIDSPKCPNCHAPLEPSARFCPNCGFALQEGTPAPGQKGEKPALLIEYPGNRKLEQWLKSPICRIGRDTDNDIVLDFPTVSRHHLSISTDPQQRAMDGSASMAVTDLGSTNGTLLNGLPMRANEPQPILPGDVLRIGDTTGNSVSLTLTLPGVENPQTRVLGKQPIDPASRVVIGRETGCKITLDHPAVSRQHAEITRQPDGSFTIRDLRSTNGTFVDGQRVVGSRPLARGSVIQIGPYRLIYDEQLQGLTTSITRGHRLDAISLGKKVGGGKKILDDISLSVTPGEFISLVGGSGAGKSTLLRAMNGFSPATEGQMLIDGEPLYSNLDAYRTIMGYVPQDDIIHKELTVRRAMWYAARLRLPDASKEEIEKRIKDVLETVDLTAHADKAVHVLSGGQRKRVSIAVELLAQPDLLFLDEATSGLDPGLEKRMMYDLNRLADRGKTIILVTHATANIEQCDHVAFLTQGHLSYYGPPKEAIGFFEAQDFADIYLKITQEVDPVQGKAIPPSLEPYYTPAISADGHKDGKPKRVEAGVLYAEKFRASPQYQSYINQRQSQIRAGASAAAYPPAAAGQAKQPRCRDSGLRQIPILSRRHLDLIRNDKRTLFILLLMMPIIALLFMMVSGEFDLTGRPESYAEIEQDLRIDVERQVLDLEVSGELTEEEVNELGEDYTPAVTAQQLLVMLGLALTQAGTFGASYEIVKEQAIFKRERSVNLRVWSYVLAKVVVLGAFAVFQVASVLLILGLRVNLDIDPVFDFLPSGAIEIFFTLLIAVVASIMFGLFISAIVPSPDVVLYVILVQLFVQIILSGTLFPLGDSPVANIASKLVISHWTMDALGSTVDLPGLDQEKSVACSAVWIPANEQMGLNEPTTTVECASAALGDKLSLDYDHEEVHLLICWLALTAMAVFWGAMTIFIQRRKKTD